MNQKNKPTRAFAFIDSQNLNLGVQKSGWKMDWRKFRKFLADDYGATRAYMFIGYVPENVELYEQMHDAGYMVVLKPTFDITKPRQAESIENSSEDKKPIKGNIDADLVLWAMKEMSNYEKAIIVSGDGDFYSLVEYLVSKGRLLKLLVPSSHYSQLFNHFENYIVRIDNYRRQLTYRKFRHSK